MQALQQHACDVLQRIPCHERTSAAIGTAAASMSASNGRTRERNEIRVCPNGFLAKPVDVTKFALPRTLWEPRKPQTEPLAKPVDVTKFALNKESRLAQICLGTSKATNGATGQTRGCDEIRVEHVVGLGLMVTATMQKQILSGPFVGSDRGNAGEG